MRAPRRLLAHTIWGPGRVDHVRDRYRLFVLLAYLALYAINVVAYRLVDTIAGGSIILRKAILTPGANIPCRIIVAPVNNKTNSRTYNVSGRIVAVRHNNTPTGVNWVAIGN